jgi:UDP-glucuronate 4-epimerase
VLRPISPYAATKVSGELLGHVYAALHGMRFVGLRFFNVYGPRQRPDQALHKLGREMLAGRPVTLYGDGTALRDFTYVGDIVGGIRAAMAYEGSAYELINLGCHHPVSLLEMVRGLERALGKRAEIRFSAEQPGDVPKTHADIGKARRLLGFAPSMDFESGLARFSEWLTGRR